MVSRRSFLIGGLAGVAVAGGGTAALVEAEVLPGRVRLDRKLGRCGTLPAPPPTPGVVNTLAFGSRHRGVDVTATVVLPAGRTSPAGLPVAVALHGNGETGASVASALALDHYLTDAVASRNVPPFALVAVDGGANTYWHARRSGDDPITMITDELLPRLGQQGARVDPFAAMTRRLRGRLHPAGAMSTGCHDQTFWRTRLPDQLTFLGHHLA